MLLRTWMIIWKEFIQISRDPRMLGVVVLLPIIMLLIYGYAINLDVNHVQLAVCDMDHSRDSRDLIGAFTHSGYFDVVRTLHSYDEAAPQLDQSKAQLVLIIPPTYSADLAKGRSAQIQLLADGSDSTTASAAIGYAGLVAQQQSLNINNSAMGAGGITLPIDLRIRYLYNPELKSTNFIIPGLIAVILAMLAAMLTSATVVRERERGTLEQLIVSPVKPIELMVGKLVPYIVIAFGDVILIMVMGQFVFHVPLKGSAALMLALSGLFVIASLGIGLLASTIAQSQQVAMMIAMLTTQLPTFIFSGFVFPISSMPQPLQVVAMMFPATHFIHILRAIYLKGSGFHMLWQPSLFLLLIGVLMLVLSAAGFKKKL